MKKFFETVLGDEERSSILQRVVFLVVTTLALTVTMTSIVQDYFSPDVYTVGGVAKRSVVSGRDFLLEDSVSTKARISGSWS